MGWGELPHQCAVCVSASVSPITQHSHTSLGRVGQQCLSPPPFVSGQSHPCLRLQTVSLTLVLCFVWFEFLLFGQTPYYHSLLLDPSP